MHDPKEESHKFTRTTEKAQHEMASWASVTDKIPKKRMVCESLRILFFLGGGGGGGEAPLWASENYTGRLHYESHSPEWPVVSKFNFQHCT